MKKVMLLLMVVSLLTSHAAVAYSQEIEKTEIRFGMHEKKVAEQCGKPLQSEKIKTLVIPRKKALYDLGEDDYAIIYFSFWRVQKIIILEDTALEDATEIFKEKK